MPHCDQITNKQFEVQLFAYFSCYRIYLGALPVDMQTCVQFFSFDGHYPAETQTFNDKHKRIYPMSPGHLHARLSVFQIYIAFLKKHLTLATYQLLQHLEPVLELWPLPDIFSCPTHETPVLRKNSCYFNM